MHTCTYITAYRYIVNKPNYSSCKAMPAGQYFVEKSNLWFAIYWKEKLKGF